MADPNAAFVVAHFNVDHFNKRAVVHYHAVDPDRMLKPNIVVTVPIDDLDELTGAQLKERALQAASELLGAAAEFSRAAR